MVEANTIFDLERIIKENGLYRHWMSIMQEYRDDKLAKRVVKAIEAGNKDTAIKVLTDAWHKVGIEVSGMTKKEYFENPDVPLWERSDWIWNEEADEWEYVSPEDESITKEELIDFITETRKKIQSYSE